MANLGCLAGTKLAAFPAMMFPKKKKKSTVPLVRRTAGQSIRDEKERLTDNKLIPYYYSTAFLWLLWAVEEFQAQTHQAPSPRVLLCLAIIATGISVIVLRRLFGEFRRLNRGEKGELCVAELLDDLRSAGYRAFHDLPCDGFNVDHVVVGPAGVFAIETKFRSGYGEIEFRNGEGLFVGTIPDEKDCLKQARSSAVEISRVIKNHCGMNRWVKPLVVFVGDWKVKDNWRDTDTRVITDSRLQDYLLAQDQPELIEREIELICSHLKRTVKS